MNKVLYYKKKKKKKEKIIIIIVIIIKHFHQLKTVIVTIRNLEWLNSIGCVILFWSVFYVSTKNIG